MEKLRIIVGGFIGLFPAGGVAWDYVQYPLGLHLLGHDVYYIEDTMQYSKFQLPHENWDDATQSIEYLKATMELFGFGDRWAYRDVGSGLCYGLDIGKVRELCASADVFINISAATFLRDEYFGIPKRVLIDSDPMFTQVQDWDDADPIKSADSANHRYGWYNYRFSFGENIGKPGCLIPDLGLRWYTTRQPVCLNYWKDLYPRNPRNPVFTTVMNWAVRPPIIYMHEGWGQKNTEFLKFIDVPSQISNARFQVALAAPKPGGGVQHDLRMIANAGWALCPATKIVGTPGAYREFISTSSAEFSVAKEAYVKSKSGWFSCRSACYLAAGKPVIAQDTGWTNNIDSGRGLLAFDDLTSSVEAIKEVMGDLDGHSLGARAIAQAYFDSDKVLRQMLETINTN